MGNQSFEVICNDALEALSGVPDESFDALVMDPPYCSGGITPAAVQSGGMRKYVDTVSKGSFADSMSQIALYDFLRLVVVRGLRKLKSPGAVARDCLLEMTAEEVIACAEYRITNERKKGFFERDDAIQWGKLELLVLAIFQKSEIDREKGTFPHI